MSKKFLLVLILVLVPLLAFTACNGGGATTTTTTSSTSPTQTTTTTSTTQTTTPTTTTTTTTQTTTTITTTTTQTPEPFILTSASFADGDVIPVQYSWNGGNKSPQFSWSGAPEGTVSFVLIMDDINAQGDSFFCHWIVFNIPADVFELEENQLKTGTLANGAVQGFNSYGAMGYGGPYPPPGSTHNYRFRLYALDTTLTLNSGIDRATVINAIEAHILGFADYTGTYTG